MPHAPPMTVAGTELLIPVNPKNNGSLQVVCPDDSSFHGALNGFMLVLLLLTLSCFLGLCAAGCWECYKDCVKTCCPNSRRRSRPTSSQPSRPSPQTRPRTPPPPSYAEAVPASFLSAAPFPHTVYTLRRGENGSVSCTARRVLEDEDVVNTQRTNVRHGQDVAADAAAATAEDAAVDTDVVDQPTPRWESTGQV